jgi:hypothetical protein
MRKILSNFAVSRAWKITCYASGPRQQARCIAIFSEASPKFSKFYRVRKFLLLFAAKK